MVDCWGQKSSLIQDMYMQHKNDIFSLQFVMILDTLRNSRGGRLSMSHVWNHQFNITMLQFALFHNAKYYTNSMLSCIHVNTTKLCNISCTLVATCLILQGLECIWFVFDVLQLLPIKLTQQNSCCISKYTIASTKIKLKIELPFI